jgi:hypothetical protein
VSRDPGHRVLDGRWALVQYLHWLAHAVAAGRVECATFTITETDKMHTSVRMKGQE